MPANDTDYFAQRRADEEAIMARQRKSAERRALEQLAAGGGGKIYSGQRQKRMAQVEESYWDEYRQRMMGVAEQEEAARQAGLGREHELEYQGRGFGQEQTMGGLEFGWAGQLQGQAQEAQRALASDKAYYQSYLQDQVASNQMTMQQAQMAFQDYSMQADQQFAYAQQMGQQQYGYGMAGMQNQWDVYGQTLGYQHEYGMGAMGIESDWATMMATQQFAAGMAEYGFEIEQRRWIFQSAMQQLGANAQYHLAHIAEQAGSWVDDYAQYVQTNAQVAGQAAGMGG